MVRYKRIIELDSKIDSIKRDISLLKKVDKYTDVTIDFEGWDFGYKDNWAELRISHTFTKEVLADLVIKDLQNKLKELKRERYELLQGKWWMFWLWFI